MQCVRCGSLQSKVHRVMSCPRLEPAGSTKPREPGSRKHRQQRNQATVQHWLAIIVLPSSFWWNKVIRMDIQLNHTSKLQGLAGRKAGSLRRCRACRSRRRLARQDTIADLGNVMEDSCRPMCVVQLELDGMRPKIKGDVQPVLLDAALLCFTCDPTTYGMRRNKEPCPRHAWRIVACPVNASA